LTPTVALRTNTRSSRIGADERGDVLAGGVEQALVVVDEELDRLALDRGAQAILLGEDRPAGTRRRSRG
jgi:hypothetical protein